MQRYEGGNLGEGSRIAVVANDAIGNFAVATPLLQVLQARGCACDLYSGNRVSELVRHSSLVDSSHDVLGSPVHETIRELRPAQCELVVNLEHTPWAMSVAAILGGQETPIAGPCVGPGGRGELPYPEDVRGDLWRDREWASADLPSRYPFLGSGHISEIFVRLLYIDDPVPGYLFPSHVPSRPVPPVLVALSASLPTKLWPVERWIEVCRELLQVHGSIGLLGAPRKAQGQFYKGASDEDRLVSEAGVEDLRGALTLPEVVGALASARLVLTLDNGILHLAAAGAAPVVGLFRPGIVHLWCPRRPGLLAVLPREGGAVADISLDEVRAACGL